MCPKSAILILILILASDEAITSKAWLETRSEPWDEVIHHWKETFDLRKQSRTKTVCEFYAEWPLLKHTLGPSLVSIK